MTTPLHVAVIYTDAGGGHRASAHALRSTLEATGRYRVTLINPYKTVIPHLDIFAWFGRRSGEDVYNEVILRRGRTRLACWAFYAGLKLNYVLFEAPATRLLARRFEEIAPDIAVSVMPLSNRVLLNALARYRAGLRTGPAPEGAVLITDWRELARGVWFPNRDDYHAICGTEEARADARRQRRLAPRVHAMGGLLVRPEFAAAAARPAERGALGLDPDRPVVTVLYGAQGSERMVDLARQMARVPQQAQVVFLCGRNAALAAEIDALDLPYPAHVLGFTDRVPHYLSVSDVFIGKPGPGSVSEALALGVPVLLDRSLALPQEAAVLRHVLDKGLGQAFSTLEEFETLYTGALAVAAGERPARRSNTSCSDIVTILDRIAAGRKPVAARHRPISPVPEMRPD
ncbi:glycosyltransferase [Pseudodonghicola flavimaris]|uniref:Glycosyltransferase n=1 Tax=Pseudodonghicola flavimaris TaxID=3050036 RepID=A0ABT7EY68_9RHOB|nr:glycosyltransferase [Pseudodonghicola flavimaris]MDK3017292.1 glycosyltransferase [Pseudodonghicola flavimaris]